MVNSKILLFFSVSALIIFGGCGKEENPVSPIQLPGNEPGTILPEQGKLVSAKLEESQPIDAALNQALLAAEQSGIVISDTLVTNLRLFKAVFSGVTWQLQKYNIVYNTMDIKGNTIQLAGSVSFINETSGKCQRTLDAVSLFHTGLNFSDKSTTFYEFFVIPGRSLHNHLVVYPYYQGIDIDKGKHTITVAESLLKARQSIDCEIAALELVKRLGIDMAGDYYTANLGFSNGGAAALATQYLLENDPEYETVNRDAVRLKGSYVAEGFYSYSDQIRELSEPEDSAGQNLTARMFSYIKKISYIACVTGTYDTWKGLNGHFTHVNCAEDYFSDYFLAIERPYWNAPLSFIQRLNTTIPRPEPDGYAGYIELFRNNTMLYIDDVLNSDSLSFKDIVNPYLLEENGMLDMSHPFMVDLIDAFSENDVWLKGWTPQAALTLSHSEDDEFLKIKNIKKLYDTLSDNGTNSNVKLKTVGRMNHIEGSFYFLFKDILAKEEPWKVECL